MIRDNGTSEITVLHHLAFYGKYVISYEVLQNNAFTSELYISKK